MDNIKIIRSDKDINWSEVRELLKIVDMEYRDPEVHKKAFGNSFTKAFIFDEDGKLIAMGRAISDGAYEAGFYDIAVLPDKQGLGLGRMVVEAMLEDLESINVILFSAPGKEGFYSSLGFKKMLTGMARFAKPEIMEEKGFTK